MDTRRALAVGRVAKCDCARQVALYSLLLVAGGSLVALVATRDEAPRDGVLALAVEGGWEPPEPTKRCAWVEAVSRERDAGKSREALRAQYAVVAEDANSFYRGTAHLFWADFVSGGWGAYDLAEIGVRGAALPDGTPLRRTSTWTWVTGDQHLSNFGAWKNRHGDVVLGVNDFDEAAPYDFRIDVWRVATSIYNHGISNGLGEAQSEAAVLTFCDSYVEAVKAYVGNDDAQLFEVTAATTQSEALAAFLEGVDAKQSQERQMDKFTDVDAATGERRFVKCDKTKLEAVDDALAEAIRGAFTRDTYGASLVKVGWRAPEWSDDAFAVLDVARRVGSGVGSFGVGRYYVLLRGTPDDDDDDDEDGGSVILDVKYEPEPAIAAVIGDDDRAWYEDLFAHEAARAVLGQRALTSYADPYAGWIEVGQDAYVVRQRSPWKAEFDLSKLKTYAAYAEYIQAIAISTATSHVRGTVAKAPATFKDVIAAAFGKSYAKETWGVSVAKVAAAYREQVILDFDCFAAYAKNESAWPAS